MGQLPNHRFSITRERETTSLEANLDLVRQSIARHFTRRGSRRHFPPTLPKSVSTKNKQSRKKTGDRIGGSNSQHSKKNGNILELPDSQDDSNFAPYLEAVEDLKEQLVACQKAMKSVHTFYEIQKHAIQDAVEIQERLDKMTTQHEGLKTTIRTLKDLEREKNEELDKKIVENKREAEALLQEKEKVEKSKADLESEKEKLDKRAKATEAEQKAALQEKRSQLEKEQQQKYEKREEALEKETQERRNNDKAKMTSLEAKNKELTQRIEEREAELKATQKRCKNAETLQTLYEEQAENLKKELATAENEFGLNCNTNDF
ncbi:hypothetical protein B0O99DRAFT_518875 [Bisporella sp. PMI_857]|nr:hypothetical protein B0O99DRAFT_518875 [Bisporella sp. PMI_857]